MANNNFLIIDGNSIMNRAFYGIPTAKMKSKSEGIYTNAIYGFLNIYWMIIDRVDPSYIAVSFDLHAKTFRHEMYEEYKGTRKGMPDELREQMPVIKEILTAMNVPIIELEGYEADDVIGTVAHENTKNNIFTYVLTGDKDSFQLISDTTHIIIPTTRFGKTEYNIYTPELLMEKQNIEPYQVIHIKGLMGDASDNIPGVKGIGEKTAYSLIAKYETIETIYANIDELEVTPKVKEKLVEGEAMSFLSKDLATIDIKVPINLDYDHCKYGEVHKQDLYELFTKLEFTKFLNKFDFADISNNTTNLNSDINKEFLNIKEFKIIDSLNISDNIEEITNILKGDSKLSYILNLTNYQGHVNKIKLNKDVFAFYFDKTNTVYVFDLENLYMGNIDDINSILKLFISSNNIKLGYNVKQDILYFLNELKEHVHNFSYDIMIAYYLMNSNRGNYNIDYILEELYNVDFNYEDVKEAKNVQISFFDEEANSDDSKKEKEEFLTKAQKDNLSIYLKAIYTSHDEISKKLEEVDMLKLFNEIEMPLTETLASMEHFGMYIDLEHLNLFNDEITKSIKILEKDIYELAGEEFNINSTQQLGNILFNKLLLPTFKKNKTGFSTDKDVLEKLMGKHEIIDKILEYRQLMKLKTTYVDGLKTKIAQDGRIHTTFMQTVASTGRLSSTEPNLQNIPIRLELGSKIRSFFTAEEGNVIVDADYSQIELRVLAHMAQDEKMIEAFNNDIDIHRLTASQVFEVPLEEVTSKMRSNAKAVNFGIVYGISEFGLAKNINISRSEAKQYISNYLEKYSGIKEFMDNTIQSATEKGYVTTIFGRRRYIPELKEKNKNVVQFGERIAMNTPIQGTAADIIKLAMNKIYISLKENEMKSKLIMQVHDELIIEAVPDELDKVKEIMYDCMEHITKLVVPLSIDLNVGNSWYDAK